MSRQAGFQVENNFTRGLITEATGLNFPENASTETYDCVFENKGGVSRRLGFDYEGAHEMDVVDLSDAAITEYVWNAAGDTGDTTIVVTQIGTTLYYYVADTSNSVSSGMLVDTTDLLTFEVGTSTNVIGTVCQFASGQGYLFVVHPLCEPFFVEYASGSGAITETQITIKCRDFEGDRADANYENIATRPASNSNPHHYNLKNQGWADNVVDGGGNIVNPVTEWDTNRTDFPSNADVWWYYKDTSNAFDTNQVDRRALGNTPAPKGHYILDEFDTDRNTLSGLTGITERDSGGRRPGTVAFFTGRIWYSGVVSQDYSQKIYFSQITDNPSQFGKCYQLNDPTSEDLADLLPSDGGVILIQDVGRVIKLFPMADSLIVFGTNGIWAIAGSEGTGFKATDYAVRKISAVESLNSLSFVDVYGNPVWWNTDGIFTITAAEITGTENVQSLTDETIRSFILDIPSECKSFVKGVFNPRSRIIQWIYRSTSPTTVEESYTYDRVLNFNLRSKAFYPWTISTPAGGPKIHGIICTRGPSSELIEDPVVDGSGDIVVDTNGDTVFVADFAGIEDSFSFRYLTSINIDADEWNITWSQALDTSYLDWTTAEEDVDYESYFFSGYKVHGDAVRFFEANYLTIFMTAETNASCFLQGFWDYADSASSARVTNPQQVYRNKLQRNIQQTRKKIRGRGRSLQFKFYSETGKSFNIHGWGAWETQNSSV